MSAAPLAEASGRDRLLGILFILGGAVCFSTVGVIVRSLDGASVWQVVLYRGLALAICVQLFLFYRYSQRAFAVYRSIGWLGIVGAAGLAWGSICYVWAFFHTTVANAVFFFGVLPMATAFTAWLLYGERVRGASWAAMAVALVGIVVMFYGGFILGGWFGNVLALFGIVGYTALTIAVRAGRAVDMVPLLAVGALMGSAVAIAVEGVTAIGWHDLVLCSLIGVIVSVGFMLLTAGARYVRAGELSLLSNFELMLGPIWVWLVVAEVPTGYTLVGGAIIVATIVAQAFITTRPTART